MWRSFGGLSAGRGKGEHGGKIQGFRSITGRFKIDRGMLRTVDKIGEPKNLHAQPMDMN